MSDPLSHLVAAADGLLVASESDEPFAPFVWPGPGPLTPAALVAHLGLPPDTPVELGDLDRFFGPRARERDWMSDQERADAARFAALRDRFLDLLASPTVYRVGTVEIRVFIVGLSADASVVGLQTTVVET